jgi:aminomethyltransferase
MYVPLKLNDKRPHSSCMTTAKDRREKGGFIGAEEVQKVIKSGPSRRRVGLVVEGAPARRTFLPFFFSPSPHHANETLTEGSKIFSLDSPDPIGAVTSGIPSPTLGKNIAMGYVQNGWHKKNTELEVEVRGKKRKAVVTPMPFVQTSYWRGEDRPKPPMAESVLKKEA